MARTVAPTRKRPAASKSRLPHFVEPALATLVDAPPSGDDWLHEMKYDGYRCLVAIGGADVVCYTRSGQDWTDRFQRLVEPARKLGVSSALLDGEVAVLDERGVSSFALLQNALKTGAPLVYCVFDLLWHDGEDVRQLPLVERKKRLRAIVGGGKAGAIRFSDHIAGHGTEILKKLCVAGYEGIVSKRRDAPYRSGRGHAWLKIKCGQRQEFVIGGWTPSQRRRGFRSLLIGYYDGSRMVYAGRVGTGFDAELLTSLGATLERLETRESPFEAVPRAIARGARWVTPTLVAEIAFAEFTQDGLVRQGSFLGLRTDKKARSVVRETPRSAPRH
jgi:bifunctional non-homologous end joining protein LigD